MSRLAGIIPLLIVTVALIGCGGDDVAVQQDDAGNAHPDNASVTGRVVQADNPLLGLSRAIVTETSTGRQTEAGANGLFTLQGLPAGETTQLVVETPRSADYDGAVVVLPTRAHALTAVNIAVLPVAVGTPTALFINPENATVERGGTVQYGASVFVNGAKIAVEPTWVLSGPTVGSIDARGLFTGQIAGTGVVRAIAGNLIRQTAVTVTGAAPPDISTVLVSASLDRPLPATGGPVTVTAAVSDGDGVEVVYFDFFPQHSDPFTLAAVTPVPGTTRKDGTWRVVYNAPANDNRPATDGTQAPQFYSVRIRARDLGSSVAVSEDFYDFSVAGLDPPPPPAD